MPDKKITVTDEMIRAARREEESRAVYASTETTLRAIITAALDAAPTTDEDARKYIEALLVAVDTEKARAEKAEKERDHFQETTNTFRDKFNEADERAERAEQERDEARDEAAQWRETAARRVGRILELEAMTARELLDAAWEAAYVPEDGSIPAGTAHIRLDGGGTIYGPVTLKITMDAGCASEGRRLLDPPTPKRPEWADAPAVWADANPNADGTPHRSVFIFHTLHDQWEDGCGEEYKTWEMEHLNPVPVKEED